MGFSSVNRTWDAADGEARAGAGVGAVLRASVGD